MKNIEDLDLFNDDFLDFLTIQLEKNSDILESNPHYKKFTKNYFEVNNEVEKISNPKIKSLFEHYMAYCVQTNLYENCLAYYLGLKTGTSISKLKN